MSVSPDLLARERGSRRMDVSPDLLVRERRSRTSKVFCDHCNTFVGRSTYYRHRSRLYNTTKRLWITEILDQSSESDSTEGDSCSVQEAASPPTAECTAADDQCEY